MIKIMCDGYGRGVAINPHYATKMYPVANGYIEIPNEEYRKFDKEHPLLPTLNVDGSEFMLDGEYMGELTHQCKELHQTIWHRDYWPENGIREGYEGRIVYTIAPLPDVINNKNNYLAAL